MALSTPSTPQQAQLNEPFISIYTMYYRHQTNHLISKNFRLNGDLRAARDRAEQHCTTIGAKLNFVQPFISDLGKEEAFILNGGLSKEKDAQTNAGS